MHDFDILQRAKIRLVLSGEVEFTMGEIAIRGDCNTVIAVCLGYNYWVVTIRISSIWLFISLETLEISPN
jgi:hypothetical protein